MAARSTVRLVFSTSSSRSMRLATRAGALAIAHQRMLAEHLADHPFIMQRLDIGQSHGARRSGHAFCREVDW